MWANTQWIRGKKKGCVEAAEVCNITEGCIWRVSFSTSLCSLLCLPARSCRVKLNGSPTKCRKHYLERRHIEKSKNKNTFLPLFTAAIQRADLKNLSFILAVSVPSASSVYVTVTEDVTGDTGGSCYRSGKEERNTTDMKECQQSWNSGWTKTIRKGQQGRDV